MEQDPPSPVQNVVISDESELEEKFYGLAREIDEYSAQSLKAKCLLAWQYRKDKVAHRAFSFVWGRNARHFAKAAEYWADHFNRPEEVYSTDEYLAMVYAARIRIDRAYLAWNEMHEKHLRLFEVKELVDMLAQRERKAREFIPLEPLNALIEKWRTQGDGDQADDLEMVVSKYLVRRGVDQRGPGWRERANV